MMGWDGRLRAPSNNECRDRGHCSPEQNESHACTCMGYPTSYDMLFGHNHTNKSSLIPMDIQFKIGNCIYTYGREHEMRVGFAKWIRSPGNPLVKSSAIALNAHFEANRCKNLWINSNGFSLHSLETGTISDLCHCLRIFALLFHANTDAFGIWVGRWGFRQSMSSNSLKT